MRRLAWRAASGGTAATSPPRSSMGERRKWRPVRRARAADEKNDFRNVNIGVLRLFVFVPRSVREESPGNGATAKKDAARELFWETRTTGCVPGTGVRGRGQRAQAVDPPRTGVFKHRSNVAGVRIASRSAPGAENGKGSERKNRCRRIGRTLGQPGRGFSAAGSVRTRMRLAGRLAGSGRVRQACRRRARGAIEARGLRH